MGSTDKLGSLAGKRASQGTELYRCGDRCCGHPLGCPGSQCADGCFWGEPNRLVCMAGDRHVAQSLRRGEVKTGCVHLRK